MIEVAWRYLYVFAPVITACQNSVGTFLAFPPDTQKMASKIKAQVEAQSKGKRKHVDEDGDQLMADGDARPLKKKNKQRVLLLCSRGVTHRMRHFMNDLEVLLPHVKKGVSYGVSTIRFSLTS